MSAPEIVNGVDLTQYKTANGDSAYRLWNEAIAKTSLRKDLEELVNDPDFDLLYTDNLQFDSRTKFKGTKITEIMTLVQEARDDAFSEIEDLEFTSPNGNKVTLSEEIDKMIDNKADYKSGALPNELEGLL